MNRIAIAILPFVFACGSGGAAAMFVASGPIALANPSFSNTSITDCCANYKWNFLLVNHGTTAIKEFSAMKVAWNENTAVGRTTCSVASETFSGAMSLGHGDAGELRAQLSGCASGGTRFKGGVANLNSQLPAVGSSIAIALTGLLSDQSPFTAVTAVQVN